MKRVQKAGKSPSWSTREAKQRTSLNMPNPVKEVSDDLLESNLVGLWRWCSRFIVIVGKGAALVFSLAWSREMRRDDGGRERECSAVVEDE